MSGSGILKADVKATRQFAHLDMLTDETQKKLLPTVEDLTEKLAGMARGRAPVREGKYLASIRTKMKSDASEVIGLVIAGGKGARHANLIEGGTRRHEIRARSGGSLKFRLPTVGELYRRRVTNPGTRAQRVMTGSLEELRSEIETKIASAVETVAAQD